VLVQVPNIDKASVNAKFSETGLLLSFNNNGINKDDDDENKNTKNNNNRYGLILKVSGELNVAKCRYDVADKVF
jgi:hypothetical protein